MIKLIVNGTQFCTIHTSHTSGTSISYIQNQSTKQPPIAWKQSSLPTNDDTSSSSSSSSIDPEKQNVETNSPPVAWKQTSHLHPHHHHQALFLKNKIFK